MDLNVGIKDLKEGTNILNVAVPEYMKKRRSTGIEWLDESLGGVGMVPSQVMMLTGAPGVGKTTLVLQLADSLTKMGHIAIYNTGEESLYQTKMLFERMKLKNGFIVGQDHMVSDLLKKADNVINANPGKQVFLLQDSLQTLNDGKYKDGGTTGATPLRCCEMITNWTKTKHSSGSFPITIWIGQATKSGEFAGKNKIKHAADTHGTFYFDHGKKSPTQGERLFEITKNRFGCNGKTFVVGMNEKGVYKKAIIDDDANWDDDAQ